MNFEKTRYFLQSVKTAKTFRDAGWTLDAPGESDPTLVRAIYENRQLTVQDDLPGMYKFAQWLPINRILEGSSAPVTYRSEGLSKALGIENLWITFSGYWPERGALMTTCSFKETEAYSVCARLEDDSKVLVVASAGNTARAFARVCSENRIPLLLCVPEECAGSLWFEEPLDECVRLVCTARGSDYFDAIHLSGIAASIDGFFPEGGAKNVARRDGMGTTLLSAVTTIGKIPGYYFQAVGSGTGAIAAWEANMRFLADGRFGKGKMKLMVSQNSPFTPIYNAWKQDSRALLPVDDKTAREEAGSIYAKVLSNRKPPYSIAGGLFDALKDTAGDVFTVSNGEAAEAASLFRETEGIDIDPAAAVALSSLGKAVMNNSLDKSENIMLNITGGGEEKFKIGKSLFYLQPSHIFPMDFDPEDVKSEIVKLF